MLGGFFYLFRSFGEAFTSFLSLFFTSLDSLMLASMRQYMLTGGRFMRVIGGMAKGHSLKSPSKHGVRPTGDRVKEALFNILRPEIEGSLFLDLFAGSGGIGIEALSQGAKEAFFVERHPQVVKILLENLKKTSLLDRSKVIKSQLPEGLLRLKEKTFDLIFLDPPYRQNLILPVCQEILSLHLLSSTGLMIVEHEPDLLLEMTSLELIDERKYGKEVLSLFSMNSCR